MHLFCTLPMLHLSAPPALLPSFFPCRAAITFGIMMWPNLWLLFLPIPQSSFLQQLTGLDYSHMIRYHR